MLIVIYFVIGIFMCLGFLSRAGQEGLESEYVIAGVMLLIPFWPLFVLAAFAHVIYCRLAWLCGQIA